MDKKRGINGPSVGDLDSHAEVVEALGELHGVVTHHVDWLKSQHNTLINSQIPDEKNLATDTHHHCQFGRWYKGLSNPLFHDCEAFPSLGLNHTAVHASVRNLGTQLLDGVDLSADDLTGFMDYALSFHESIRHLQYQLWTQLVDTDPLTGLSNRRNMLQRLATEAARNSRKTASWCIAMIDIDHFKRVNDELGHAQGDRVLQHTAQSLAHCTRPYDQLFRYGGEEFLLCLPHTGNEEAVTTLKRIRAYLADNPVVLDEVSNPVVVRVSCGVVECNRDRTPEENIHCADQALYQAKKNGRDQIIVWKDA